MRVPGEVQIALRGGHTTRERVDVPPEVATSERDAALVDRAAAGAAFEAVRRVELLVDHWGTHPPVALRSGALAVRDLKAAADFAQLDEPTTALVIEVAAAAGLLATWPDPDGNPAWTPTEAFDAWCDEPAGSRWTRLARAWLDTERLPFLVGTRDDAGKTRNALDPEHTSRVAPETRAMTLAQLAALPSGLRWSRPAPARPRWSPGSPGCGRGGHPSRAEQVVAALSESGHLGITGLGGLASYARALVAGDDPAPLLTPLLPDEVDHVLIQADLTAVAPGPLVRERARDLHLLADVESRGQATVYRFTAASVRRAFDAGWAAHEVHAFLAAVSRTPVPQPLTYLVDDAARTYGTVRVGHAEAFLRADDEAALTELLHHPRAGVARPAPAGADRPGQHDPARRADPAAARARGLTPGREHRRERPRESPGPAAGPTPGGAPYRRRPPRGPAGPGRHRDPRRRQGRGDPRHRLGRGADADRLAGRAARGRRVRAAPC